MDFSGRSNLVHMYIVTESGSRMPKFVIDARY